MSDFEELPESWQAEIKNLRSEAASYRTKYAKVNEKQSEYETALKEANERFDSLQSTASAAQDAREKALAERESVALENLKYKAAIAAGVPQHAARLQGSSLEELQADAEAFSKTVSKHPLPKDHAAGAPVGSPKDDPITSAFRNAGLL